mmetsp:Transcript_25540/g.71572  ORF Transcript_25540/g.71572 Transcript_25540/m.71572 type:complete len:213 (-) Transcript_25540:380-1018(-)
MKGATTRAPGAAAAGGTGNAITSASSRRPSPWWLWPRATARRACTTRGPAPPATWTGSSRTPSTSWRGRPRWGARRQSARGGSWWTWATPTCAGARCRAPPTPKWRRSSPSCRTPWCRRRSSRTTCRRCSRSWPRRSWTSARPTATCWKSRSGGRRAGCPTPRAWARARSRSRWRSPSARTRGSTARRGSPRWRAKSRSTRPSRRCWTSRAG